MRRKWKGIYVGEDRVGKRLDTKEEPLHGSEMSFSLR